jgi:NADH dehydrogenase [ubiquinone] 1 alpha subcomplex assembly factor 1
MKITITLLSLLIAAKMTTIFQFSTDTNITTWRIVNDGVMGGISKSSIAITEAGHGKFSGHVSLANNGGFASVQHNITLSGIQEKTHIVLRIKGDGKAYEFRLKSSLNQSESYVHPFKTTGEWETIRLKIADFYPQFRGRKLNLSNFNFDQIAQICFLIANKQEEDFELLVDWIGVE